MPQVLGFAVVGEDGSLLHSSNVNIVTKDAKGAGSYHIHFDFDAASCCQVASIADSGKAGYITAFGDPALGDNVVTVKTYAPQGGPRDLVFQLLIAG